MNGAFSEESLAKFAELANQTQAADFAEGEDTYDFTRCVRPDGSFYGTRGKCRKGSETGAKELPEPRTEGGAKRRATAEGKKAKKAASRAAAAEKIKAHAARNRAFKDELLKIRDQMKGASAEEQNRLIEEASKRAAARQKPKGGLGTKPETPEEKAQLRAEVNKLGRKPSQLKPEEKAAAAKRRGGPHAQALVESRGAWKDQEAVVKERKTELDRLTRALKIAEKAVKENRTKETVARYKLVQRAVAQQERFHAKAEKDLLRLQRQTSRLAKRNERAQMTPAQLKQAREMDRRIREMG